MTAVAIPFVFSAYVLGISFLITGWRLREWAIGLAGSIVLACLTFALIA